MGDARFPDGHTESISNADREQAMRFMREAMARNAEEVIIRRERFPNPSIEAELDRLRSLDDTANNLEGIQTLTPAILTQWLTERREQAARAGTPLASERRETRKPLGDAAETSAEPTAPLTAQRAVAQADGDSWLDHWDVELPRPLMESDPVSYPDGRSMSAEPVVRCDWCAGPVPEGRTYYCSDSCAAHARLDAES